MANPNIARLKKKATDFEQKKQFDRALSLYIQLLEEAGRDLDDADLQLFNRVGDLLQRQGNVSEALAYYEKAVDVYAERGFLNNAIALCNKILRQSPARTTVYYKLGKISASKGFKSDAKKNFLEYADRMQKAGHVDEAFRALKEFADLCPDQDDIRLMLAEWLNKENRKSEAIEQLEVLYSKLESEGRKAEARATIDRIKAIDPEVTPRASGAWQAQKSNDLVFLDIGAFEPPARRNAEPNAPTAPSGGAGNAPPPAARVPALDGLILAFDPEHEVAKATEPVAIDGFVATASTSDDTAGVAIGAVEGFEAGGTPADAASPPQVESILAPEESPWTSTPEPIPLVSGLETPRVTLSGAHPALAPLLDEPPMSGREFAELPLVPEVERDLVGDRARADHDLAIPSDLPLLPADGGEIDLLRVLRTPIASASIDEGGADAPSDADAPPPTIDLLELPPLGTDVIAAPVGEAPPMVSSPSPFGADDSPIPLVDLGSIVDAPVVLPTPVLAMPSIVIEAVELPPIDFTPIAIPSVEVLESAPADVESPTLATDEATPGAPEAVEGAVAEHGESVAASAIGEGGDSPAAADAMERDGGALVEPHDVPEAPRTRDRDTLELVAIDGSGRRTDEIVVVPSEDIDEETKRSLRLEFALDGEETPDAWVEAALGATDDRSLDRFLTPLGVPVIAEGEPAPAEPAPLEAIAPLPDESHVPGAEPAALERVGLEGAVDAGEGACGSSDEDEAEPAPSAVVELVAEPPASDVAPAHEDGDGAEAPHTPAHVLEVQDAVEESREVVEGRDASSESTANEGQCGEANAGDDATAAIVVEGAEHIEPLASSAGHVSVDGSMEQTSPEAPVEAPVEAQVDAPVEAPDEDLSRPHVESLSPDDELKPDAKPSREVAETAASERSQDPSAAPAEAEFDLLDELTPPFMRQDATARATGEAEALRKAESAESRLHGDAGDEDGGLPGEDDTARASVLDVETLRAVVDARDGRDDLPAESPDAATVVRAFEERVVDLPLLDIDGEADGAPLRDDVDLGVSEFSVDDLLAQAPSFAAVDNPEFVPDPALARELLGDDALPPSGMAEDGDEPAEATEEWPADAAPEVLIDGEWRDEHMGDLVSGEVSAIVGPSGDRPHRDGRRFDDLSAALMWPEPSPDDPNAPFHRRTPGSSEAFFARMHTPRSTLSFGGVEAQLRRRLELDPANVALRRQLGEALLDQGDREEGLLELDIAMRGYEQVGDLDGARTVADIVLRVIPTSVRHHQKRVEYAVRSNDRVRLVEAYVELADSLFRSGEPEKARVVYSRVLELSPGNGRARFALGLISEERTIRDTSAPAAPEPSVPVSPEYVVGLFDRSVPKPAGAPSLPPQTISSEIPVVVEGLFVSPPASVEPPLDLEAEGSVVSHDVASLISRERERESTESAESAAPPAVEDDADAAIAPFPAPSLDDEIDAAFAEPPVVEPVTPPSSGILPAASDYDFVGTPPVGAATIATPFAADEQGPDALPPSLTPASLRPVTPLASPATPAAGRASTTPSTPATDHAALAGGDDDFIDLGSWLREDAPVRTTRMVTTEAAPSGDEQADFDEMLRRFKQGVAENVDEEDYESHYDLGVAFKEMGLIDEAIAEFQKALRGDSNRVRSYEALGQCFVEKGQLPVAATLLRRALETTGADDQQLVGVLYLLGYASEVMARHADALGYYQRVFAVDIEFRDVAQRVAAMEHVTQ